MSQHNSIAVFFTPPLQIPVRSTSSQMHQPISAVPLARQHSFSQPDKSMMTTAYEVPHVVKGLQERSKNSRKNSRIKMGKIDEQSFSKRTAISAPLTPIRIN